MVLLIQSTSSLASTLVLDSYLPKNLKKGKFKITLSIFGVNAEEVTRGGSDPTDAVQQLKNRIQIFLPALNPLIPLPVSQPESKDDGMLFSVREHQKHTETNHSDGTRSYMYFLEVEEKKPGSLVAKAAGGKIKVSAFFYLGGNSISNLVAKTENITILTEPPKEDALPPQLGISSGPGKLDFLWTLDAAPNETTPTDMNIILIEDAVANELTLPAFKVSRIPGVPDKAASCSYKGGVGYCLYCDGDYYLDMESLAQLKGVTIIPAKTAATFATASKLAAGKYFLMAQYAPHGIVQSECEQAFVY